MQRDGTWGRVITVKKKTNSPDKSPAHGGGRDGHLPRVSTDSGVHCGDAEKLGDKFEGWE